MLKFRMQNQVPPGNVYFYHVEETDTDLEHPTFQVLLLNLRSHYAANGLTYPENMQELVEDYMCHMLPESFCRGTSTRPRAKVISRQQIRDFTKALLNAARYKGSAYVDQAEADKRAAICVQCKYNTSSMCTTCDGLKAFAKTLLGGGRETRLDQYLKICYFCGCLLRVKVHMSDLGLSGLSKQDYPEWCWLRSKGT